MTGTGARRWPVRCGIHSGVAALLALTLLVSFGGGTAQAARVPAPSAADGSFILVHAADGQGFTADTTPVRATGLRAWWIDPATGLVIDAGSVPRARSVDFHPPQTSAADGGRAWVLVVGDATRPLGGTAAVLGTVFGRLATSATGLAPAAPPVPFGAVGDG